MSPAFSKKLRLFALYVVLPLVIAKLLWSLSLFFLDKGSVQKQQAENYSYRYNLNLSSKIIGGANAQIRDNEPMVASDDGEQLKNMKLKGTYLGGNASFMIIEDAGKSSFIYIGESHKGYELIRVSEKKVSLEKNGKNYYILLRDEPNKPSSSATPMPNLDAPAVEVVPGMPASITKKELNSYVKDPNKIWKSIRIQEQRVNGQITGFRVNYVKKSSFFENAGLQSGDIIKGIDGNEITSLADVMKYYTNIDSLESLTLTVERAGEELELDFNVN